MRFTTDKFPILNQVNSLEMVHPDLYELIEGNDSMIYGHAGQRPAAEILHGLVNPDGIYYLPLDTYDKIWADYLGKKLSVLASKLENQSFWVMAPVDPKTIAGWGHIAYLVNIRNSKPEDGGTGHVYYEIGAYTNYGDTQDLHTFITLSFEYGSDSYDIDYVSIYKKIEDIQLGSLDKLSESIAVGVVAISIFLHYADEKLEFVQGGTPHKRKKINKVLYTSGSPVKVNVLDKSWYTTAIRTTPFTVSGFWRNQRYGPGLTKVKRIWIAEFTKSGYIRHAKKDKAH